MNKLQKASIAVAILITTHLSLRFALYRILLPDRGIDLTDEGLYLLSAKPTDTFSAFGWPWGWLTSKLFILSGNSVSEFRILGAELLFITSFLVSYCILVRIDRRKLEFNFELVIFSILIATSSLYFYSGMLRTPGYNYINFIGSQLCVIGILCIKNIDRKVQAVGYFSFSTGIILALSAKPSTPVFFLLAYFMFKRSIRSCIILFGGLLAEVILLIVFKIWPLNFHEYFFIALGVPALSDNQTPRGALIDLFSTPLIVFNSYLILTAWIIFLLILLFFKVPINNMRKLLFSASSVILVFVYFSKLHSTGTVVFADIRFATFWINAGVIVALLWKICETRKFDWGIFALPFIGIISFGFGSSNSIVRMSELVVFYLVLYSAFLILNMSNKQATYILLVSILAINFLGLSKVINDGQKFPYRSENLLTLNQPVEIAQSNRFISLDLKTAEEILSLQKAAYASGFTDATHLVNLISPWEPGVSFLLGGRHPRSVMFAIFGYENTFKSASYWMNDVEPPTIFQNYWLLLRPRDLIPSKDQLVLDNLVKVINKRSKLSFPKDFELVVKTSNYELWKPSAN
jgi:hypothetical protein